MKKDYLKMGMFGPVEKVKDEIAAGVRIWCEIDGELKAVTKQEVLNAVKAYKTVKRIK